MILENMKLIFDDEYSRLYFDEANRYYVLWLMIVMLCGMIFISGSRMKRLAYF